MEGTLERSEAMGEEVETLAALILGAAEARGIHPSPDEARTVREELASIREQVRQVWRHPVADPALALLEGRP
jgi:hypothetical protein